MKKDYNIRKRKTSDATTEIIGRGRTVVINGVTDQKSIAIGKLCFWKNGETTMSKAQEAESGGCGNKAQSELALFLQAKAMVGQQLAEYATKAQDTLGEKEAAIFAIHVLLLEDVSFLEAIEELIQKEGYTAIQAVTQAGERYVKQLSTLQDDYIQERAADLQDVVGQLQNALIQLAMGEQEITDSTRDDTRPDIDEQYFIVAEQMLPSEVLSLNKDKVAGLLWSQGSFTSHAALLAKGLQIPVMLLDALPDEDLAGSITILDGALGELRIAPTEEEIATVGQSRENNTMQNTRQNWGLKTMSDSVRIMANVNSVDEAKEAYLQGADGIGLLRSEMLFLLAGRALSEEEQFQIYRQVLEAMQGKEVVIRALDLGGDKLPESMASYIAHGEVNPALGLRGVRLLLTQPELLKTQLRALYRAGVYGNLKIMYPMITSKREIGRLKEFEAEVKDELMREQLPFAEEVPSGIMIETPAAALLAEELAKEVDFFSIGTNDLQQYTVAVDRQNRTASVFADQDYRATLKLVEMTASAAKAAGISVTVCGDMAADCRMREKLIQIGIQEFSVPVTEL